MINTTIQLDPKSLENMNLLIKEMQKATGVEMEKVVRKQNMIL